MPATAIAYEPVAREHLRTFHLTARGLEDYQPAGKLYPVIPAEVLDGLRAMDSVAEADLGPESLLLLYGTFLGEDRAAARSKFLLALLRSVAYLRSAAMDSARRCRCEGALATLESALRMYEESPVFWLFHASELRVGLTSVNGRGRQCPDPCSEALEFCNRQLSELAPVLRALRIANLEAASVYDPAIHDGVLERFDWQSAQPDEIAALPAVVVIEPAERLAQFSLTSFSRLLRAAKPVQILVPASFIGEDLCGSTADFGAVSLAHRGAFVLQSSTACQEHLYAGLAEMARTPSPAVAIISVPMNAPGPDASASAWRELALLSLSHAFPLFRYDPARKGGWAERFELMRPGPAFTSLTPLVSIVLSGRFREHFRIVPAGARDEDLLELHEYLKLYETAPPLAVPFLRVTDSGGMEQRIAVTRELMNLCYDRSRAWEMLTALASPGATQSESGLNEREQVADAAYRRVLALLRP